MKRHIILGPPGTGKTTTLINLVEKKIKDGIDPQTIGYFTFTTNAATEAKEKAFKEIKLDEKKVPFFCTLHSICLKRVAWGKKKMIEDEHYTKINRILNLNVREDMHFAENKNFKTSSPKNYLTYIDLSRARRISIKEQYDKIPRKNIYRYKINPERFDYMYKFYEKYKEKEDRYDFTDMLYYFLIEGTPPKLKYLFIDEAQDLSALQWKVVKKFETNVEQSFFAGDDDQAIYRWCGADVEQFINLKSDTVKTLDQSHRVPKKIYSLAHKILSRISNRREKKYFPKKDKHENEIIGVLEQHNDDINIPTYIQNSSTKWLILCSYEALLKKFEDTLIKAGIYYSFKTKRGLRYPIKKSIIACVENWEDLQQGKRLDKKSIENIYLNMNASIGFKYGSLAKVQKQMPDHGFFSMEDLQKDYGLLKTDSFDKVLTQINTKDLIFLKLAKAKGETFDAPRVTISTIHKSKGTGRQNVVLYTDISPAAQEDSSSSREKSDDLHRLFYVGVTRASESLHIIRPQTRNFYPI